MITRVVLTVFDWPSQVYANEVFRFANAKVIAGSLPIGYDFMSSYSSVGVAPRLTNLSPYTSRTEILLTPDSPIATFQYDNEFAGFPYLVTANIEGDVRLQLTYGEQFPALQRLNGDGPWTFTLDCQTWSGLKLSTSQSQVEYNHF